MHIIGIDSYTLNGAEGIVCRYGGGTRGSFVINTEVRERAGLGPAVDSYTQGVRSQTLQLWRARGSAMDEYEFDELVNGIFWPALGARTLYAERDGVQYSTEAYVTALQDVEGAQGVIWEIEIDLPSGLWHASAVTVVSDVALPVAVAGNVPALPTLTFTGGDTITRQRVTFTDRTGHGVSAYLVSVTPAVTPLAADSYVIFANGLQVPFMLNADKLYFRIDCPPAPDHTFVDIYQGAVLVNTVTANRLDSAGTSLDASVQYGAISSDPAAAISNPLAPSLAWHPGVTYPHEDRRPYVYGLDGSELVLIDSDVVDEHAALPDDVDSYVIVTGSEAERIRNLSLSVTAGYQKSIDEENTQGTGTRRMRVRIAKYEGIGAINDEEYYVRWQFGNTMYPNPKATRVANDGSPYGSGSPVAWASGDTVWTRWRWTEVGHVEDFAHWTESATQATVTNGSEGVFYVDFPEESFNGIDIPLISMSMFGRPRSVPVSALPDIFGVEPFPDSGVIGQEDVLYEGREVPTDEGYGVPMPAHLFQADWVSPVTNEPMEDNDNAIGILPDPLRGQAKAVVKYKTRDTEHWITAWSQTVSGVYPSGTSVSLTGLSIATPNAVEIAIGLEPVAKRAGVVDWARLEVTSVPIIDLQQDKMPASVKSAAIPAKYLNATARNLRTGAVFSLVDYFADGGVVVDTETLEIYGYDGIGPVYGVPQTNKGAALFHLMPGDNDVEGDNLEIQFRERLAV